MLIEKFTKEGLRPTEIYEKILEIIRKGDLNKYMLQCEICEEYFFEVYNYNHKLVCEDCMKKIEYLKKKKEEESDTGRRIIE